MDGLPEGTRGKAVLAFVTGGLYVVLGCLQVVAGLGLAGDLERALLLGGGALDGLIMVVIGLVFVQGFRELRDGLHEGVAFVYVGILLSVFFLVVQLTQISASYIGAWTVGGDWEGYSALDTVSPFLYLSPLALIGLLAWRRSFTLNPHGVESPGGAGLINSEGD
ncbi:MAG: hypothetical protein JSW25_09740 [Thermoplasmata archaeon]|nr:MAG: hypothetical protein JSW25_09740 [Thermoplasmata archaeon]